jgi:hypothetical protein
MASIEDYLKYHIEYTKLYGDKTIILYEHESFFQIYRSVCDLGVLDKICKILNIKQGFIIYNSDVYDYIDLLTIAIENNINKLVNNDYIVVLIKIVERNIQYNILKREVTNIYFPSSYIIPSSIENNINKDTNYDTIYI